MGKYSRSGRSSGYPEEYPLPEMPAGSGSRGSAEPYTDPYADPYGGSSRGSRRGSSPEPTGGYTPVEPSRVPVGYAEERGLRADPVASERIALGKPERRRGSASVTGRVVSIRNRSREKGLLNNYFGSLFRGESLCTAKKGYCLTIDTTSEDYLSLDRAHRRTMVVNLNGEMYSGDISPEDIVTVKGNWDHNGVLNAARVYNQTNSSTIRLSPAIPALLVRLATLAAVLLVIALAASAGSLPGLPAGGQGGGLGGLQMALLVVLLVAALVIYIRIQLRIPSRGFRKAMGWAVLILVGILLYFVSPSIFYGALTVGLMLWGIAIMLRGKL